MAIVVHRARKRIGGVPDLFPDTRDVEALMPAAHRWCGRAKR